MAPAPLLKEEMDTELIAPCGMNCGLCSGYLALKNDLRSKGIGMPNCAGCRPRNKNCAFLKKRCDLLQRGKVKYCYECDDFPCQNLQHIDERYRKHHRMSMVENLIYIKSEGIEQFLIREEERWRCPECGETICCHNGICFNCGLEKLRSREKVYRWTDD